jgi:DNA repair exonuclease SbcCD ATPase subunit
MMVILIFHSIGAKLSGVATSIQEDKFPLNELQRYIHDQLQHLRAEVLRYDEAVADYRKAQHANEVLTQEANAQKEHRAQLEEQIHGYRQNENDLKCRYARTCCSDGQDP